MSDNRKDINNTEENTAKKAPVKDAAALKRLELAVYGSKPSSSVSANEAALTKGAKKGERHKEPKVVLNRRTLIRQRELIIIVIPFVLYGLLFYYIPLGGWITAFQKYKPAKGLFGSEWVGLFHFEKLFSDSVFLGVIRNTLAMGVINLVLSFAFAIAVALLLNEVRLRGPKRFAQTVSYLPTFYHGLSL